MRTLGGSLAAGLLAEDNATIDTEQMIIAAIADIEAPQLACWISWWPGEPGRNTAESADQRPAGSS